MNILEVNYNDLMGRIYDGYDLHLSLNEIPGISATQYVLDQYSTAPTVKCFERDNVLHQELRYLERKYSISQLLVPYGRELLREEAFLKADVVHLHILHLYTISLLDLPEIMMRDNVVWTFHDPWIVTGNCIYPMECSKWKMGCWDCEKLDEKFFEMYLDNTDQLWAIKKQIFSQLNPYVIVATKFMERYIRECSLTAHWNRLYQIPFGIKPEFISEFDADNSRKRFGISTDNFVVGFRASELERKGCRYIFEALEQLNSSRMVQLFVVGEGTAIPPDLQKKYSCILPKWFQEKEMIEFYRALDVFLMPSLAETFGLMAVEAMACETAVICFQSTVLEEVTNAPECGVAVEYGSAEAIKDALARLIEDPTELKRRKSAGKAFVAETYPYDKYVERHLQLYQDIKERKDLCASLKKIP